MVPGLVVGRLLGAGGSSAVWLVENPEGQRFALKIARRQHRDEATPAGPAGGDRRHGRRAARPAEQLPHLPHPAAGPGDPRGSTGERSALHPAAAITEELRLLRRFAHDHLLRVHRIVETDQGPGMLMELAPGGSLLGLLTSRGPLPVAEVVTALVPIGQVLGYLHAEGALHGDVTPGNILFTSDGRPLLGDFGTGRLLGTDRRADAGTPGFIDPTRVTAFDPGSDVFALAAVAWFALTGRIPGPTRERPPLALINPEVPVTLMHLIEDGLSPDRDRRPAAGDFAATLLRAATPAPVDLVPAVHTSVLPELLTRLRPDAAVAAAPGRRGPVGGDRLSRRGAAPAGRGQRRRRTGRAAGRVPRDPPAPRGRPRPGETVPSRALLALVAGALAVLLLTVGLALTVGDAEEPAARAGAAGEGAQQESIGPEDAPASTVEPLVALEALVSSRAEAFRAADAALLAGVDVEGSPALAADTDAVQALADADRSLAELTITIRRAVVLSGQDTSVPAFQELPAISAAPPATEVAVIRATAALSSYTAVRSVAAGSSDSPSGEEHAGADQVVAGSQELVFVLWDAGSGWLIHSVLPPP